MAYSVIDGSLCPDNALNRIVAFTNEPATALDFYNTVDTNQFDAFGNGGSTLYSPMGYAGQYHDAETGFVYLRARYYNPAIGRFISEDPHWNVENMIYGDEPETDDVDELLTPDYSSIIQSINLYPYCANNPVLLVDPSGEIAGVDDAIVIVGGLAVMGIIAIASALSSGKSDPHDLEHGMSANQKGMFQREIEDWKSSRGMPPNGNIPWKVLVSLAQYVKDNYK